MRYVNVEDYLFGIDEVGRGCFAGPCVVVGINLKNCYLASEFKDSKLLSKAKIKRYATNILTSDSDIYFKIIDVNSIDTYGIGKAVKFAIDSIINKIDYPLIFIDYVKHHQAYSLKKGDNLVNMISGASIIAKYYRDQLMLLYDFKYPQYGLKTNVGYGTKKHFQALRAYGIVKNLHRLSYKPIKELNNE